MPKYEKLSEATSEAIKLARETGIYTNVSFPDSLVVRRHNLAKDTATVWRPTFVHDIDKIIHCPFYNRYTDKTQVFSLYKNDDITRRSLHVQLVSRISRTIGAALHLLVQPLGERIELLGVLVLVQQGEGQRLGRVDAQPCEKNRHEAQQQQHREMQPAQRRQDMSTQKAHYAPPPFTRNSSA